MKTPTLLENSTLVTALLVVLPCTAIRAADVFPIATNPSVESALSMAFDGTNYLVGISDDEITDTNHYTNITAQLVSPTGSLVGSRIKVGQLGDIPFIAFEGTNYLLVWKTSTGDISGQRVSRSGTLVGGVFAISTAAGEQKPKGLSPVAFGGGNYLVVWDDDRGSSAAIYGQIVAPSSALVGSEILIDTGALGAHGGSVGFDGTNFLVVWQQRTGAAQEQYDTVGMFITPAGTKSAQFVISQTTSASYNPATLGFNGTNYLVTWNRDIGAGNPAPEDFDIYGRLVSPSGAFPGEEVALVTGSGNQIFPGVAFDGANYLLSWTDSGPGGGTTIKSRFFNRGLWALDAPFEPFAAQGANSPFMGAVMFDGSRFTAIATLAHVDPNFIFLSADVYGTFIPKTAVPLGNFIGADNFNDNQKDTAKWGADYVAGGAVLTETNGRFNFTSDTGSEVGAGRVWCLNYGSYTQDWEVQFEVNIGTVALTTIGQQVDLDMTVANTDSFSRAYQEINFNVTLDNLGTHRAFNSNVRVDYTKLVPDSSHVTSAQSAVLRVTFEAATKTLKTWYSETSGAQAPNWQLLRQVDIDAVGSNWQMTAASTFSVALGGFSNGFSVTPEHAVFIDNFQATSAVPLAAIDTWRLQYFGNPANSGNGADSAMPDQDGIANLLKYGLVIAPGSSGVQFLPPAQTRSYAEGKRLALVFTRDPARNDITLQVQGAASLAGPWTALATSTNGAACTGTGFVSETNANGGLKTVETRDTVNMDAAPRRFMRINVTR